MVYQNFQNMNKILYTLISIITLFISQEFFAQQNDSIPPANQTLPYPFATNQDGSLYLSDFDNYEVIYDAVADKYIVINKIGSYEIRFPIVMTQEEYQKYRLKKEMHDYYKGKVGASGKNQKNNADQKDLLPKYYIKSDLFETIFGSNEIEVNMQGNVEVKLGLLYQRVDNPQLNETNRTSTIFDFDQNIGASITAKVGKRLKVSANYDTQSTFDFQNIVKLEFDPSIGYDDDGIIRKIEVGNISMPMRNTLINGAQNLFGLKTELQFGKTTITTAFAKQQSQSKSVTAQGGSIIQEFDMKASDYDEDRHFFLAQYFEDNFDRSLKDYPLVSSKVQITKIEVWATNTNRSFENVRNIVALADLGESVNSNINPNDANPSIPNIDIIPTNVLPDFLPDNSVNEISTLMTSGGAIRQISSVNQSFASIATMAQGRDYSVLENARRLVEGTDFILDKNLGYISLNRKLADSEVLAVAFEYTVNGSTQVYKVGELSSDGIIAPDNLVVKLLRSELVNTSIPMWDLMMKNIYNLQAYQLQQEGFRLEILYANDATGVPINSLQNAVTPDIAHKTLLNLLYVDRLDYNNSLLEGGDGYYDYVQGLTVFPEKGYVMFPKTQPFGSYLATQLTNAGDAGYIFNELYDYTQTYVKNNFQQKDKYSLKGYYKSDSAQGIALGAFNVPRGSVHVTSGGRELIEGVDYVVDYQIGRVKIINPSIEASNAPIEVSVEQNSVFSQQRRSFFGIDIEHKFNKNFVAGVSYLRLSEQPFTNKVLFGQEPIKNSIFGLNATYSNESYLLTKIANQLTTIDSENASNFSIRGDVAYLLPGTPKSIEINGQAASYIDDFEGTQIPMDIRSQQLWYPAATPQHQTTLNLNGDVTNSLDYGKKRARLAWYNIDNDLHGGSNQPDGIDNNEISRAEVRRVTMTELFPNDELDLTESSVLRTLDLAFFPNERGEYNFDLNNTNPDGTFNDPENRWGGISRPLTVTDFDNSNIEYIQFWLMDPYKNYSIKNEEGLPTGVDPTNPLNQVGELYFNLGNISEDILNDNRKMYENGLPEDGNPTVANTDKTVWGVIPKNQSLLYAFDDNDDHRLNQDIGFDGLNDVQEKSRTLDDFTSATDYSTYQNYLNFVNSLPAGNALKEDLAQDNFKFYKHPDYDNQDATILNRYKKYNGTQGNSPTANMSPENYAMSYTQYPDTEDINKDQTMSTVESYFQYKVSLDKDKLVNWESDPNTYIVDKRRTNVALANGATEEADWYQFRIPIAQGTPVGGIDNFNSIRFMRMFLTKFRMPVVLRFGQMEMVRGEWRRYKYELANGNVPLTGSDLNNYESAVVNIEENDGREPIHYILPPGIERERLQGTTTVQLQNEQSLALKVKNLEQEDSRALYKNVNFDIRMFKKLQMFIHAEAKENLGVSDNELVAVIRIGSDLSDNYYQIEKPLKITPHQTYTAEGVWPADNELNVDLDALKMLKLQRYEVDGAVNALYPLPIPGEPVAYRLRVKGNPNLGNLRTIMLGVQNKSSNAKSAELWFNEMRVSDFDNKGGWAAVVSADANLGELMDVSVTGRMSTMGYGNVDQSVNERSQEDFKQYDVTTSVNAGKLLPTQIGLQIPVNFSIGEEIRDPKYDAQYQDILFADTNENNSPLRNQAQDYTKRMSVSVINMRKNYNPKSTKKQHFYDVENLFVSYAYNQVYHRDYNIEKFSDKNVRASLGYTYSFKPIQWEPFKNLKTLDTKYGKFIKEINFNPIPNNIAVNSNIFRTYNEQLSRSLIEGLPALPILRQRNFMFDWDYNIGLKPTKSIRLDFRALNNHVYDEFNQKEDFSIYNNFFDPGNPVHYHQTLDGSYQIPIDKIPLFNFVKSNYSYKADFDWQGASPSFVNQTGNMIQNANTHNLSVDLDMKKFYKEIGFEKIMRSKTERERDQKALKDYREAKNKEENKDKNLVKPVGTNPRILVNTKDAKAGQLFLKGIYDVVTAVKTLKVSYAENNGTLLPGYVPEIGLLGRDNYSGGFAPTLGFVFGSQVDIRNRALENGWLLARNSTDDYYSKIYSNTHYQKIDAQAKITPFKDFDIDVSANKIYTQNLSEQLDIVRDNPASSPYFAQGLVTETGNFSMSYLMLGSTFKDADELFDQFKSNRNIIAARLANETGLAVSGFGITNQQVVLPAFLAAYSGKSVDKITTDAFRDVPLPNWQINYRGLMKLNWFKKNFSGFSIGHGYRSSYTIVNYTNNAQYNPYNPGALDISGNYFNPQLYTNLSLMEEFSPLVKVEVKLKNALSITGRINSDRAMTLNFNNNTMTQDNGKEYVVGLGYRIKDVPLSMRLQGKKINFKGDVNMKLDVSLRNDLMKVRYFGLENSLENDQITGGQTMFNLRFIADYNLTKYLQTGLYYIQDASKYAISTTYPRKSISAGLSFKYTLGNQ